jgi:hypothetical protein
MNGSMGIIDSSRDEEESVNFSSGLRKITLRAYCHFMDEEEQTLGMFHR